MADRSTQDNMPFFEDEAFEEALDAAEVFNELAAEETERLVEEPPAEEAFADEFELPAKPAAAAPAAAEEARPAAVESHVPAGPGRPSIGELFKPVVKHSPPSRIRIEPNSVGTLFRRFIEQG